MLYTEVYSLEDTMSTTIIINICLEIFASVILAIIIASMLFDQHRRNTLNRRFFNALICCLMVLQSDIISWIFYGSADHIAFPVLVVSNFCVYAFAFLGAAAYHDYIIGFISKRVKVPTVFIYIIRWMCWALVLALFISQFNHMFYYIDETNHYCRGDWYYLVYIAPVVIALIQIMIIFSYRKKLGAGDTMALLSYNILLFAGALLQLFLELVMLLYIFAAIGLFVVYIRIQVEQAKKHETEMTNARVDIMLSQIQPHFLYNTLSTIENLCRKDPEKAEEMTHSFAEYLRENMDSLKQKELVTFTQELKHIEIYLKIEKMRFKERLAINYNLEVTDFCLPILTLQPLVENAVRYGVTKLPQGGTVTIETHRTQTDIQVIVADNGVGFDSSKENHDGRSHVGIENVKNRLTAQCGGTLQIESSKGVGTTCTITIPLERTSFA